MNIKINNWFKKFFTLFLILLITIVYFACDIKDPVAPSWEVGVNIPIINKEYTLFDVIEKDSTYLKQYYSGPDVGLLYYSDDERLEPITIKEELKYDPRNVNGKVTLDSISVNPQKPINATINVNQWAPTVTPGTTMIFPPVVNISASSQFTTITSFEEAKFRSGIIELKITNNNGVDITINQIILKNSDNDAIVLQDNNSFDIPNNSTTTKNMYLTGITVPKNMKVEITFSSLGTSTPVPIPQDARTDLVATLVNYEIDYARAQIPAQPPFGIDSTFVLDDSTYFKNISIDKGTLNIHYENKLDVVIHTTINIPDLITSDGNIFNRSIVIQRKSTNDIQIPISNYALRSSSLINELKYNIVSTSEASSGIITIQSGDNINYSINLSEIIFKSFEGRIKPTHLNLQNTVIDLDFSDVEDKFSYESFDVKNPIFKVLVKNSSNIPVKFYGILKGSNGIQTANLNIPTTNLQPNQLTEIVFPISETRTFLSTFKNKLPEHITVSGESIVNPDYTEGSVTISDSVYGSYSLEIPLNVGLKNGSFTDTMDVDLSSDERDQLSKLDKGNLTALINNKIPMGGYFSAKVYDENFNYLMNFPPRKDSIAFGGADVDNDGNSASTKFSEVTVDMTKEEFNKLSKAYHIIGTIILNSITSTSNPNITVRLKTSDPISIKGFGGVNYLIDPED
ncbi:MAG: hypothetical protein STSR0008_20010 [Ignavibacterium sp.]